MKSVINFLVRHPIIIITVILVITAFFGVYARNVRLEGSMDNMLLDNEETAYFEKVKETFGSDAVTVVALVTDNIFTRENLQALENLTDNLSDIEEVERVVSLTNVYDVRSGEEGEIDVAPLLDEIPSTSAGMKELRKRAYENELFIGNLISADGKAAAVNVYFSEGFSDRELFDREVDGKVLAVAAQIENEVSDGNIYIAGVLHTKVRSAQMMKEDIRTFTPFTFGLIVLVLIISFRRLSGVLLPLATVGISLVWTLGLMGLMGQPLTLVTVVLPSLLIAIGSSYSIHVLTHYYEETARAGQSSRIEPREEVVARAIGQVALPVSIAGLTTMVGFAALMVNPISGVRELGFYSVFGLFSALVVSATFLPAVLTLCPIPASSVKAPEGRPFFQNLLHRVGRFNSRRKNSIIGVGILVMLICTFGVIVSPKLIVDTDFLAYFKESSDIRLAGNAMHEHLAGASPFFVVLTSEEEGALREPAILRKVDELQTFLESIEGIDNTISMVDYLKVFNKAWNGNDAAFFRVPDTRQDVASYLEYFEMSDAGEDLERFLNVDGSEGTILVRSALVGSTDIRTATRRIDDWCQKNLPAGLEATVTGTIVLLNKTADAVSNGQIKSLSVALLIIFVIMSLLFLSVKIGVLSMLPNILPIGCLFGFMSYSGLTLNMSTSIIACIALGIAVDDTIHYMALFNRKLKDTRDQEKATFETLLEAGRPITFTSVALFLGFIIIGTSNFGPVASFGYLTALVMVVCLVGDIIFLPALLTRTKIITMWDMMAYKLGPRPQESIPLFEGMRNHQAKVVILMGMLREYRAGETILKEGELTSDMYVIIKGTVEVSRGGDKVIARLSRGEIFGEMALVRATPRSANIIAIEDGELLMLNEEMLQRLRRRYPRIGARVLLNLTKILSNRLEETTRKLTNDSQG